MYTYMQRDHGYPYLLRKDRNNNHPDNRETSRHMKNTDLAANHHVGVTFPSNNEMNPQISMVSLSVVLCFERAHRKQQFRQKGLAYQTYMCGRSREAQKCAQTAAMFWKPGCFERSSRFPCAK